VIASLKLNAILKFKENIASPNSKALAEAIAPSS
jgi:hypothetical protein